MSMRAHWIGISLFLLLFPIVGYEIVIIGLSIWAKAGLFLVSFIFAFFLSHSIGEGIDLLLNKRKSSNGYDVPPPPFKASKKVGWIMHRLWDGRITVAEARARAEEWGMNNIEEIIAEATAEPSYWWHMRQQGQ